MALDTTRTAPRVEDFTPLSQHQEQTPGTFFGGNAILHLHGPGAQIKISPEDLESQSAIRDLHDGTPAVGDDGQVTLEGVDVWVTSHHMILFSSSQSKGVQISYPTITVHAQDGNAVLLGLNLSDANTADEDLVFIQLRIIPTTTETQSQPTQDTQEQQQQPNGHAAQFPSQALFKAISDCQELNPDPPEEGEEDMEDETAPGATGWITSENMQDFMDENGELRIRQGATVVGAEDDGDAEPLGEGAGRTRTAAEAGEGEDEDEDEAKWQRTG